jgi:hypothetical protein
MQKLLATVGLGVLLGTPPAGPALGASVARLQSGVYEGLELAVAPDGAVAGAFTRDTDTLPHRICAFRFEGHRRTAGQANVEVRSPVSSPGMPEARPIKATVVATSDGVTLHADGLTRSPACDQLAEAVPGAGLEFSRIAPADGAWLATVSAARTALHVRPTDSAWRGYVVKDDNVVLGARNHGRWSAVFLSADGRRNPGWIDAADLTPFARR